MTNSQRLAWALHVMPLRNYGKSLSWGQAADMVTTFGEMPEEIKLHILKAERKFGTNPNMSKRVAKHLYGQHDQSTHAPQKRAGVPAGLDLEGKRFSAAAKMELIKLKLRYEDAKYKANEQAIAASRNASNPEERGKVYQDSMASNEALKEATKNLEENYLFKDAMNVRDANGVRLGDKTDSGESNEAPRDYLLRKIGRPESGLASNLYEVETKFYDKKLDEQLKNVRTTAEESIKVATEEFKSFANEAESVIVLPQAKLNQVLADGRMKTVHETGTSQGAGGKADESYVDHRLIYESEAYGYDNSTPVSARPVSGLMIGQGGYPTQTHAVYGGNKAAEVVLKPETKSRTTWTDGDSLNTMQAGKAFDSTLFTNNSRALQATVYRKGTGKNYFQSKQFAKDATFEIQVHGGVKVSDIAKVRFFSTPSKAVIARLDRLDIPYETIEEIPS